eukprot:Gb_34183 [translate_table: standard]
MDIVYVGYEDFKQEQMQMFMDRLWKSPVLVDLSIPNTEHVQSRPMETIIEGNDSFKRGQMLQVQIGPCFKSKGDDSLVASLWDCMDACNHQNDHYEGLSKVERPLGS